MHYHDILKSKISMMIRNDLTVGRNDNNLTPFTNEEITNYIKANDENIEKLFKIC